MGVLGVQGFRDSRASRGFGVLGFRGLEVLGVVIMGLRVPSLDLGFKQP